MIKKTKHYGSLIFFCFAISAFAKNQTLYNGIQIPEQWPPAAGALTHEPSPIPYLVSPPEIILIDIGRQLFVDDFLISTTTLQRATHFAEFYPKNPVLKPDKPWERVTEPNSAAMVFSDGVWYDPQDKLFKMWYMGGYTQSTCYAVSKDGIAWEKPVLDVKPGTNVVNEQRRDSSTIWLDLEEKDPSKRFKLFLVAINPPPPWKCLIHASPDGIHWGTPLTQTTPVGDRSSVFYNPFHKIWVYSIRCDLSGMGRARRYHECPDPIAGANWTDAEAPLWIGADKDDLPREDLKVTPELYNLDAVAYESLMLGLFTIWPGQPAERPKPNYVCLGFSRDGFHWSRPDHRPFMGVSEKNGDWNWGNVQSAGGCCLVVGDKLYFYVSGRAGVKGAGSSGACSTGLAILRRDGFASMDADETEGVLITRPVRFSGKHLFVNANVKNGELRVEALDKNGKVIAPFSRENCVPVAGADSTLQAVAWKESADLSKLSDKAVRFRFYLKKGSLYAFWVSDDPSGASHGYVAAGGPGFTGSRDTIGSAAYKASSEIEQARH